MTTNHGCLVIDFAVIDISLGQIPDAHSSEISHGTTHDFSFPFHNPLPKLSARKPRASAASPTANMRKFTPELLFILPAKHWPQQLPSSIPTRSRSCSSCANLNLAVQYTDIPTATSGLPVVRLVLLRLSLPRLVRWVCRRRRSVKTLRRLPATG